DVNDTTAPSMTCPGDVTLPCPANTGTNVTGVATASDTCGSVTITFSDAVTPGCGNTETILRAWKATDQCTNVFTCVQKISVVDTNPPSITCPSNFSVECVKDVPACPGSLAAFLALGGTASDTCSTNLTYTCSDAPLLGGICGGTIQRTHTVTDACTNSASCIQIITVHDTTAPVITCQSDQTNEWVTGSVPVFASPTA